jgi:hypothetical protein
MDRGSIGAAEMIWLIFWAVATVELPGTVLLYHYLADIARRLDLLEVCVELRICGWIAGALMLASILLLVGVVPLSVGSPRLMLVGMWCEGAIAVGAAIVACSNMLRLAMALWPMVRSARRGQ